METKKITPEMYEALKKPLPTEAISQHPTKTYLSSIKAIYVTERLNDVFGCGSWQIRAKKVSENEHGMIVIKTSLTIPEYGVYYESFGGNDNGGDNNKNFDLGDAYKGATTDGITKIGSYLGIGIDVFMGKGSKGQPQAKTDQPKIETWMTEKNFNAIKAGLMSGDETMKEKAITNFKAFQTPPYGMKKEYKSELESIIKNLK
jgi:hypothetical protein